MFLFKSFEIDPDSLKSRGKQEFFRIFHLIIKVGISIRTICCADRVLPGRIPGRMRSSQHYCSERTLRISDRGPVTAGENHESAKN